MSADGFVLAQAFFLAFFRLVTLAIKLFIVQVWRGRR
jgi:hypothetical protein